MIEKEIRKGTTVSTARQFDWHQFAKFAVGVVLFIGLGFQLHRRLPHLAIQEVDISIIGAFIVALVCALTIANWTLEARKWQLLLMPTGITIKEAAKTVLVGLSFAVFTPSRLGDYAGRALHSKAKSRSRAIYATFLASVAQMVATVLFGLIGCVFMINQGHFFKADPIFICIPAILLVALYFKSDYVVKTLSRYNARLKKISHAIQYVPVTTKLAVLAASLARYAVYVLQMYLLLVAFNLNIPVNHAIFGITILFLVQTMIPMPMLFQVATKIELALLIWASYDVNPIALSCIMLTLWIVNVMLPAIVGYRYLNFKTLESRSS